MTSSNRPNRPAKQYRKRERESPRVTLPGLEFDFTLEEMLALIERSKDQVLSEADRAKLKAVTMAMAKACKELEAQEP
jgi:hypothetical protein